MAIQNRRGVYADFDPTKMVPGEFAVVQNGDPLSGDGKSVYIAFNAGNVKRILLDDETMPEGFTDEIKSALLSCFRNVAWINDQGQACYDALESALYGVRWIGLNTYSLAASATGGTAQLVATTIPAGGAVTWTSSNTTVATVSANGLVSFTGYGSATITATSNGKMARCSVLVAQKTVTSISATYTQSGAVYAGDSLDSLKSDLVVTATWSDATQTTVPAAEYVLSGELTTGTSMVTVSYGGKTTTFNVVVSAVELASISAAFDAGGNTIYTDDTLDSLKQYMTVTAHYSDGTSETINNYTLSGTLTDGTSTITVAYDGKTTTVNIAGVVDFYNIWNWELNDGYLEIGTGSIGFLQGSSTLGLGINNGERNSLVRRFGYVPKGKSPCKELYQTGFIGYPIPVPHNASRCTATILPSTLQIDLQFWKDNNDAQGTYTFVSNNSWSSNAETREISDSTDLYVAINIRKSDNSQFESEPESLVIAFQ